MSCNERLLVGRIMQTCQTLHSASPSCFAQGAAGEAAEVLPGGQKRLRDGEVQSWAVPGGPHRRHGQLQGEDCV